MALRIASVQSTPPDAAPYSVITKSRAGNPGALIRARIPGTTSQPTVRAAGGCAPRIEPKATADRTRDRVDFTAGELRRILAARKSLSSRCADRATGRSHLVVSLHDQRLGVKRSTSELQQAGGNALQPSCQCMDAFQVRGLHHAAARV